jgi:hypothetical protein
MRVREEKFGKVLQDVDELEKQVEKENAKNLAKTAKMAQNQQKISSSSAVTTSSNCFTGLKSPDTQSSEAAFDETTCLLQEIDGIMVLKISQQSNGNHIWDKQERRPQVKVHKFTKVLIHQFTNQI